MAGGFERVAARVIGIETALNMVHNLPEFSSLCAVEEVDAMAEYRANFLHRGKWWIGWTDDVPGAMTQGRTLDAARKNLRDAISLMLEPVDLGRLPQAKTKVVQEIVRL